MNLNVKEICASLEANSLQNIIRVASLSIEAINNFYIGKTNRELLEGVRIFNGILNSVFAENLKLPNLCDSIVETIPGILFYTTEDSVDLFSSYNFNIKDKLVPNALYGVIPTLSCDPDGNIVSYQLTVSSAVCTNTPENQESLIKDIAKEYDRYEFSNEAVLTPNPKDITPNTHLMIRNIRLLIRALSKWAESMKQDFSEKESDYLYCAMMNSVAANFQDICFQLIEINDSYYDVKFKYRYAIRQRKSNASVSNRLDLIEVQMQMDPIV